MKRKLLAVGLAAAVACGAMPGALALTAAEANAALQSARVLEPYETLPYNSADEYMEEWDVTPEEYREEQNDMRIAYAQMKNGTFDWQKREGEASMLDYFGAGLAEMDEQEFLNEIGKVAWDYAWDMKNFRYFQTEYGVLYADGINVQLNGAGVPFPDGRPIRDEDGDVYVPFRTLAEALHMTVGYDKGMITAQAAHMTLSFRADGEEIVRTVDGAEETIDMYAAPMVKNGRVYVPVRAFAEAAGLEVEWDSGWDDDYDVVVLLDKDALAAQADQYFTRINKVLQAKPVLDEDKVQRIRMTMTATFTEFDSLDGDKSYPVSLVVQSDTGNDALHVTARLDIVSLVQELVDGIGIYNAQVGEVQNALLKAAEKGDLELIYNIDTEQLYIKSAALVELSRMLYDDISLPPLTSDTVWFQLDFGTLLESLDVDEDTLQEIMDELALIQNDKTVGNWLYQWQKQENRWGDMVRFVKNYQESVQMLNVLIGNTAFNSNTLTWNYNIRDKSSGTWTKAEQALNHFDLDVLKGKLAIKNETSATFNIEGRMDYGNTAFTASGFWEPNAKDIYGTLHERNSHKVDFHLYLGYSQPDITVPEGPGANEPVINLTDVLMHEGYSNDVPEE